MSNTPVEAAIAIGSNLGDRRAFIESALASIARTPGIKLAARGPIREYPALARRGVKVGGPYLNTACLVRTTLIPQQLFARLSHIEREHGRVRPDAHLWAPRTLDLDLLLFGEDSINDDTLRVPHPRMHERRFVLEPLAAIQPDREIAGLNRTVAQLFAALPE